MESRSHTGSVLGASRVAAGVPDYCDTGGFFLVRSPAQEEAHMYALSETLMCPGCSSFKRGMRTWTWTLIRWTVQVLQAGSTSPPSPRLGRRRLERAPWRSPGNTPSGNGRFDQLDIIEALQHSCYLNRCPPYAAVAGAIDTVSTVPSPRHGNARARDSHRSLYPQIRNSRFVIPRQSVAPMTLPVFSR